MTKRIKLLKEIYKTHEGARRRAEFENSIAASDFNHGRTAKHYRYNIVTDDNVTWRVARSV